ncbi:unnamed protein product [Paramecium sonneborni]|uniref:Uncharacterized protein n=1 Tax=Paramecium sonneborni TaxID=65129 RepID=A0A8S1LZ93_9CILI|nr:unnamed protein product [Paramecium sonneborni]
MEDRMKIKQHQDYLDRLFLKQLRISEHYAQKKKDQIMQNLHSIKLFQILRLKEAISQMEIELQVFEYMEVNLMMKVFNWNMKQDLYLWQF